MERKKHPPESDHTADHDAHDHADHTGENAPENTQISRRVLLGSAAATAALGALAGASMPTDAFADKKDKGGQGNENGNSQGQQGGNNNNKRILLKGGIVLTMDRAAGDYAKADVLIEGSKIKAIGPNLPGGGQVIDCTDMIVMPGFVQTHHHQYETLQRAVIADGLLRGDWPQESYGSVVQNIWTTGRIGPAASPIWDLGRSPYNPEDCYISELVACWASINEGVTAGIDTSQSSHTPEHTDAMIQGLMDSGQRAMYAYSAGRADQPGYEYPGAIGDETKGLGRLRKQWFNSADQLVTLGFSGGATLWPLARAFGAQIVNHDFNGAALVANPGIIGPDMVSIHAVDFTQQAWQVAADAGVHISIAGPIEMQMGHGTPPYQAALDHNILPSLSPDVDTNMAHDQFSLMRGAYTLQRLFVNPNATVQYPPHTGKPTISASQVLEMATYAGAAAFGPTTGGKFGMLKVGLEADVIVLNTRLINTHPILNAPGAVVTLMDSSNVDTVIIGGTIKKRAGKLVGVNVDKLLNDIERAQERVLSRIKGPALVGSIPDGAHSGPGYTPSMVNSCCQVNRAYPNAKP
jgi:cytosine/adenosine deaminase-related metal-dependent hydrolase